MSLRDIIADLQAALRSVYDQLVLRGTTNKRRRCPSVWPKQLPPWRWSDTRRLRHQRYRRQLPFEVKEVIKRRGKAIGSTCPDPMPVVCRMPVGWLLLPEPLMAAVSIASACFCLCRLGHTQGLPTAAVPSARSMALDRWGSPALGSCEWTYPWYPPGRSAVDQQLIPTTAPVQTVACRRIRRTAWCKG